MEAKSIAVGEDLLLTLSSWELLTNYGRWRRRLMANPAYSKCKIEIEDAFTYDQVLQSFKGNLRSFFYQQG